MDCEQKFVIQKYFVREKALAKEWSSWDKVRNRERFIIGKFDCNAHDRYTRMYILDKFSSCTKTEV